ncbi:chemotaxis protein CheW [Phragmitibacter flavus]|uniref:Chemotaxis protein CheW n=1 Tax=Phragmitibacter flavus TaxID=2576071 RepID=A0A5R8KH55_9BACT|nr:transposase [Phragmitibacter flavus]TLD71653.1 chemotaxis protein CheW [Phragmitibacter flavus]
MRQSRLKAPKEWEVAHYHCVSRVVDRQFVLGDEERAEFVSLMRLYEGVCQVRVLTYCLMSNHFHLLVEVRKRPEEGMSEEALLKLIAGCHGKQRAWMIEEQIRQFRAAGAHEAAQRVIDGWLSRMWDISQFMKTLKQRFTQWYNKRHGRRGTLWEDRYRSTLVEGDLNALAMVGAYIDLNPVRAGLVDDPKDYRWCGYGAAVAGVKVAVRGIEKVMAHADLRLPKGLKAMALYRVEIYGSADTGDEKSRVMQSALGKGAKGNRKGFDRVVVEAERARKGCLTRGEMLRCRVRYFVDGAVIGSRGFVDRVFNAQRDRFGSKRADGARAMRGADFGGLCSLRDLRKDMDLKVTS